MTDGEAEAQRGLMMLRLERERLKLGCMNQRIMDSSRFLRAISDVLAGRKEGHYSREKDCFMVGPKRRAVVEAPYPSIADLLSYIDEQAETRSLVNELESNLGLPRTSWREETQ